MVIDEKFLTGMIEAARNEQSNLKASYAKQEGVIAFCEMLIKKLAEDKEKA